MKPEYRDPPGVLWSREIASRGPGTPLLLKPSWQMAEVPQDPAEHVRQEKLSVLTQEQIRGRTGTNGTAAPETMNQHCGEPHVLLS